MDVWRSRRAVLSFLKEWNFMKHLRILPLFLLALVLLGIATACKKSGSHGSSVPDTTRPAVAFVIPSALTTGVAIDTTVRANFTETIQPLTLNTTTFSLKQGVTIVGGNVTFSGLTATFTPTLNLLNSTVYTATLSTGIRDLAGNSLASDSIWTFTTGAQADTNPPTVDSTSPNDNANGVAANKRITATFSEAMAPATVTTTTFLLKIGVTPVAGTVTYSGRVATFTPNANLTNNTLFTATITTGAEDLAGNAMLSTYVWDFRTGAGIIVLNTVDLGEAAHFAALAGAAISTVPASKISGDIGVSPAAETFLTGFSQTDATGYATCPQVTGLMYAADMVSPTPTMLTQAKGDLTTAYNDAAGRLPAPTGAFLNPGAGNMGGLTLVPGLYKFAGAASATTSFTLSGGANDVWIFQIASSLSVSNGVHLNLAGGAQAKNIFWQVGTSATFGTTSVFQGTLLADQSITLGTGATLNGRALAFSGTIALDHTVITIPAP